MELLQKCQEEGVNIGWMHIASVTALPDESREKVLDEFIEEGGWSVRSLRERVQEETGKKSKGGRKPKAPEGFEKAVKSVINSTDSFTNKLDTIRIEAIETIKKKEIQSWAEDKNLLEKYSGVECLESLDNAASAIGDIIDELDRIHKVMRDATGDQAS